MTADTTTYPVVLATDENYVPPCGVTMESFLQNTSTPSAAHFSIFGDLPQEQGESWRGLHKATELRLTFAM